MMTYRNPNDLLCLACSTPSAIGPDRCLHRGVACTRSEPRALGAKCSVTLALERVTINGKPSFPMNSVPQRKRPLSYWNNPTSDLPRASLFEPESYFLLGPVGTLTVPPCLEIVDEPLKAGRRVLLGAWSPSLSCCPNAWAAWHLRHSQTFPITATSAMPDWPVCNLVRPAEAAA